MQKLSTLLFACTAFVLSSCDAQKKTTEGNPTASTQTGSLKDCPDDLMCTMDFRLISIRIKTADGSRLDSVVAVLSQDPKKVLNRNQNEDIDGLSNGYILATDSDMRLVAKEGSPITLNIYKNGQIIHRENYTVGHDCCHILLKEGPTEIDLTK